MASSDPLHPNAQRVQAALKDHGVACEVTELPASTASATDAASALGVEVGRIAKSLIFITPRPPEGAVTPWPPACPAEAYSRRGEGALASNKPILVITSGANRVSMAKLSAILGSSVKRASADQVKEFTGYSIGGVPPLAHTHAIQTFVDRDLRNYKTIWAAAGTAHAVFETTPDDLIRVTGGEVVDVRE